VTEVERNGSKSVGATWPEAVSNWQYLNTVRFKTFFEGDFFENPVLIFQNPHTHPFFKGKKLDLTDKDYYTLIQDFGYLWRVLRAHMAGLFVWKSQHREIANFGQN